jgi:hypothetical protein
MKGIMTREYNKPRRNDQRPPFRQNSSSNRYGEEQSSRPARPRLNREIVDRAWEQGAQTQHADYRPRSNGQGRQNNWRGNQPDYSPHQNGSGNSRPYGNRQPAHGSGGNRPYGNQQPAYDRTRDRQDNYRQGGSPTNGYRGTSQQPFNQDRYQGQTPGNRANGDRPSYQRNYPQRGTPDTRREYRPYDNRRPGEAGRNGHRPAYEEHFEGDYERYDHTGTTHNPNNRSYERPQRNQRYNRNESPTPNQERHVTRLPDGRVLKGPRPAQRKNAQFWTEISGDTDELMQHIPEPPVQDADNADETQGKRVRAKKPHPTPDKDGTNEKKSASTGRRSGVKPSQRGFKWPTP